MDAILQLSQSPFTYRQHIITNSHFSVKPFFGFFYNPAHPSRKEFTRHRVSLRISASADFSKKRQRKVSTSRSRGAAPAKGFVPKAPTSPGTQKQDGRSKEEDDRFTTSLSGASGLDKLKTETSDGRELIEGSQEMRMTDDTTGKVGGRSTVDESVAIVSESQFKGPKSIVSFDKSKNAGPLVKTEVGTTAIVEIGQEQKALDVVQAHPTATVEIGQEQKALDIVQANPTAIVEIGQEQRALDIVQANPTAIVEIGQEQRALDIVQANPTAIVEIGQEQRALDIVQANPSAIVEIGQEQRALDIVQANPTAIVEIGQEQKAIDIVQVNPIIERDKKLDTGETAPEIKATSGESTGSINNIRPSLETVAALLRTDVELVKIGTETKNLEVTSTSEINQSIEAAVDKVVNDARGFENVGRVVSGDNLPGISAFIRADSVTALVEAGLGGKQSDTAKANDIPRSIDSSAARKLSITEAGLTEGDERVDNDGIYLGIKAEADSKISKSVVTAVPDVPTKRNEVDDASEKLRLEMEAAMRSQVLEELAQANFSRGNKLFTYPQVVKAGQDIEVFLNRSLSSLKDEPDALIMGAFNDWRWRSFTIRLNKSQLNGDWWSCQISVPKQAYIIDFVFFNGKNVYDNNDGKDFHISLEDGMDPSAFEDFLIEEKQKELERLAKEQAERDRKAEEQRRIEAEKAAIEADSAQAKAEVNKQRNNLQEMINRAPTSVANIWYFEPREFNGGDVVHLFYNKFSGPLGNSNEIWIHGGHNGWQDGLSIVAKLVKSVRTDGEWWYAEVSVPDRALVLDWVFANGPPQKASVYDNNKRQDFHAAVPKAVANELYWVEQEQVIFRKLQEERRLREEAMRAKAEKTARMKVETKERTLKRFLLSQKHIVYTDPLELQAGKTATVYYNPSNTVLNGKSEIWFRGSFNRWTHRKGPLSPQKMITAENGAHVKTTVKVPPDAFMMDFVFSEREDGGIFDNKNGLDYHLPVYGGIAKETPLHIVHIAVEMAPIAKVGGLGDVVTGLSRAVQDLNHNVDIILPKYDCMNVANIKDLHYQTSYSWAGTEVKVSFGKVEGLPVYFLEPVNGFFGTGCIYGRNNDAQRFGFFCHAALEFLQHNGFHPDIIHCHDWSTAPVTWLFKDHYVQYGLTKARVVFTIHNLEFGAQLIGKAMAYSDKATTVSHTYSKEVAGNPAIAPHLGKFCGILNGIDPDIWDPFNDKFIPVQYTSENVIEGKQAAKRALQQRLGIKVADIPLVGIISRLTHQKGIHLIKHAIYRTLERYGQVVLLGAAPDPRIQNDFDILKHELRTSHSDHARLVLKYDEPLSHLIYAGADFIVVPSIFEPCGLTQLVAMRYGSIPVVRKTGGLSDTVFDVDHDKERAQAQGLEPNGFSFEGADTAGVDYALNRAISAWYDGREWFNDMCKRVMEQDWSWNRPALDYLELYYAARK